MINEYHKVIAVIPAYNEEKSIHEVSTLTQKYVDKIFICDDGSVDGTPEVISNLHFNYFSHSKNLGKGNALRSLFKEAINLKPDIIITIDADGQHDPSEIPKLIEPILLDEADIVVGSRFLSTSKTDISSVRSIGLRFINFLQKIFLKTNIIDSQSGFRAFSKTAFKVILESKENGYGIESEQLIIASKNGIRVQEVPVYIKYNDLYNTSKQYFIFHGTYLVLTILKLFLKNLFTMQKEI